MMLKPNFALATTGAAVLGLFSCGAIATTDPVPAKVSQATNVNQAVVPQVTNVVVNSTNSLISGYIGGGAGSGGAFNTTGRLSGTGQAAAAGGTKWNLWGAYSQSKVGYSFQPLQSSGTVDVGVVGLDYALSNTVIVGAAVSGDRTRITTDFNGGSLNGNGYTISPYIGVALNRAFTLDATLGFGRTKHDINVGGGTTGSFTNRRTMGSVGVTYRHQAPGPWQFSARGALLAVEDKLGAYTLTNGGFVSDGTVNLTQLRLGGQIGYRAGAVTPYVGLTYVHDIHAPTVQAVGGQTPANDRDAWTPSIGLRFNSSGALYGGIQYSSEQSRSQVKNNQILLNIGVRF